MEIRYIYFEVLTLVSSDASVDPGCEPTVMNFNILLIRPDHFPSDGIHWHRIIEEQNRKYRYKDELIDYKMTKTMDQYWVDLKEYKTGYNKFVESVINNNLLRYTRSLKLNSIVDSI